MLGIIYHICGCMSCDNFMKYVYVSQCNMIVCVVFRGSLMCHVLCFFPHFGRSQNFQFFFHIIFWFPWFFHTLFTQNILFYILFGPPFMICSWFRLFSKQKYFSLFLFLWMKNFFTPLCFCDHLEEYNLIIKVKKQLIENRNR